MEFDNSWTALFRPGRATRYFDPPPPQPVDLARPFSLTTAWWLAELSRLIYHHDPAEAGDRFRAPTRREVLSRVELEETDFFNLDGTQAAVIRSRSAGRPFSVLVFRGTEGPRDWLANVQAGHSRWSGDAKVHRGFKRAFEAAWQPIAKILDADKGPWFYTGHSLGGGLATLAASQRPPFAAYSFGAPRVGNVEFAASLEGVSLFRWVNHRDFVTRLPPAVGGERYRHAGTLCFISDDDAPALAGVERAGGRLFRQAHPEPAGKLLEPPGHLTDHAPVNYVAQLERLCGDCEEEEPSSGAGRRPPGSSAA